MKLAIALCVAAALAVSAAACSDSKQAASKAVAQAKNDVSPLAGAWQINGDTPPPEANQPQFVRLDFKPDGRLEASYVAAGGVLAKVAGSTKLKSEHDSYALHGQDRLSIVEGSRALDYAYAVRDGKLFLTPQGETQALVYQKDD